MGVAGDHYAILPRNSGANLRILRLESKSAAMGKCECGLPNPPDCDWRSVGLASWR